MRLAVMAGEVNVDAMLRRITAKQFMAWEIYDAIEPFGQLREDYRTAQILSMLYNVNKGKKDQSMSVEDFLLKFKEAEPERKQTWQEQAAYLQIMAEAQAAAYREVHGAEIPSDLVHKQ